MLEIELTCPLGSTCEQIIDGKIHRCAWYVELKGKDPQTGEDIAESRCAMAWQPLLAIEGNGAIKGVAISVQSLRNEHSKRQDKALEALDKHARTTEIA